MTAAINASFGESPLSVQEKRIMKSAKESISRRIGIVEQVATDVDPSTVSEQARRIANPGSPSSALRKVGVALIVGAPDPITTVPGVALIATSLAVKRRDPMKLEDLAAETKKILRDIQSFRL